MTHRRVLWLLLGAAIAFRLLYWTQAADNPLLYVALVDEDYYLEQAKQILRGEWTFATGFVMDPLYSWLLAGALALGDGSNPTWMRLIQILADSLNCIALYLIGHRLWSARAGLVAGALYAAYPVAWFYTLTLLKTSLTTSAVLWLTWFIVFAVTARPPVRLAVWPGIGLLIGGLTYLRGNLLLLAPLTTLVLLPLLRPWRRGLVAGVALTVGTGLALLAVAGLHKVSGGPFAALPSVAGYTLYSANHPHNRTGGSAPPAFVSVNAPAQLQQQFQDEAARRLGHPVAAWESSAYWRQQAVDYWFSSAEVLPRLLWYKANQLISAAEIPNVHSFQAAAVYAPMLLPQVPVFALALALALGGPGLAVGIRRNPAALPLLVPIVMVVATALIYYSASRLRLPMVPALLLGIGALAATDWHRHRRERLAVLIGAAVLFAASLLACHPPQSAAAAQLPAARAHAQIGQVDQAQRILDAAEPNLADDADFLSLRTYVALLERAAAVSPDAATLEQLARAREAL